MGDLFLGNVAVKTMSLCPEFVAASQAGQEALYLRETLKDFSDQQQNSTEIYEDNLACVAMSKTSALNFFASR